MPKRIAVIGAGPIGLEAALFAARAGYHVDVFERGRVAAHVCRWGHVRLFSPFGLNASDLGRQALRNSDSAELPDEECLLTGHEYAERYLLPLSRLPELANRIHEETDVLCIGRSRTWKGDLIGNPQRADDPFRLLLKDSSGERTVEADVVLDCSGTYATPNRMGAGGIACIGETSILTDTEFCLPDIMGRDREYFSGRLVLVVGSGYSAATSVVSLAQLADDDRSTRVIWLTRSARRPPIARIVDDALCERDRLAATANELALAEGGPVDWKPQRLVRAVERCDATSGYVVTVEHGCGGSAVEAELRGGAFPSGAWEREQGEEREQFTVDRIIANVGYRPDRCLYEELQIHECYASSGPMNLAAALLSETSADCLTQSSHGAETLRNPEPGFFILGAKSYGRDSRFLIKIGLEQIRDVFSLIDGNM